MDVGSFDQLLAALRDVAIAVSNYYKELKKVGFSDKEALALAINFQNNLLSNVKRD